MPNRNPFRWRLLTVCAMAPFVVGCDASYLLHVVFGQLAVSARVVPVSQALADPNLTEEEKSKLALTQQVRQFGIDRIGLKATEAYTVFDANGAQPAAFVVSACAKDRFEPVRWEFPFIGGITTKGYFDEGPARSEADTLTAQGYDVFFGRAAGFSTLGFFPDPARQSNLQVDEVELAELILHEMTHSTIYKPSDNNFNEGLATFVGRAAAQTFFDETFGADSLQAAAARTRYADKKVLDQYVIALYVQMSIYYSAAADRGEPPEQIVAEREAQFEALRARYRDEFEPRLLDPERWAANRVAALNNAKILAGIVYQGSLDAYQAVFDKVGGSFSDALSIFSEAAGQSDSLGFLRSRAESP